MDGSFTLMYVGQFGPYQKDTETGRSFRGL
jgi:hypothetical protein